MAPTVAKKQFKSSMKGKQNKTKNTKQKQILSNNANRGFSASPTLVTYMSNGQSPFPRRYRTKFNASIYGYVAAGSTSGHFSVNLNSAYLPFAAGSWPNALPAIATLQPAGYSSVVNQTLYQNVRVYGSKLLVEFLPQALTDTVQVTLTPSVSAATPTSVANAMAQPYNKQLLMSSSKMNSRTGSFISNYMSQSKLLGVNKKAIEYDLSGAYTHLYNADPTNTFSWVVNLTTPDAVALATNLEYRVKLVIYCELYNDSAAILPQT